MTQTRETATRPGLVAALFLLFALIILNLAAFSCGGEGDETTQTSAPSTDEPATSATQPEDTPGTSAGEEAGGTVTLMTHDSFAVSEGVWNSFEEETGIHVEVLRAGDAGAMLNQAILTKDNPVADVMFGVDNTFLSRALDENLFVPYESGGLEAVPDDLELDEEHRVTPIDFGDVCVNWDKALLGRNGNPPAPDGLEALTEPAYEGMLVVEDPATSSPGLAFLLATVATFGEDGDYTWQDYWSDLRDNDVLAVSGWEEAYYSHFTAAGDGSRPLVISYASSPPAEVIFAEEQLTEAPTAVMTSGAFRQIEFAGILRGTEHEAAARELIDFMLSPEFQEDIPLNMFVFPANEHAQLPPEFVEYTDLPPDPITMDPARIDEGREGWIEQWQEIVLR